MRNNTRGLRMTPMEVIAVITPNRRAQPNASGTSSGHPGATSERASAAVCCNALLLATDYVSRRR